MTTSTIQQTYSDLINQEDNLPHVALKWRQRKLLVKLANDFRQPYIPSVESQQWLVECLKHSPVQLIRIDTELGQTALKFWADACDRAKKTVFLRTPPSGKLHRKDSSWLLKRLVNWFMAAVLLVVLSPLILGLMALISIDSPGPIFETQWCVGERGKLFRLIKFRTHVVNEEKRNDRKLPLTRVGKLIRKYNLEDLPELFNVLQSDMSLIGSRPYSLSEAVNLSIQRQRQLNATPGMIRLWQPRRSPNSWIWM